MKGASSVSPEQARRADQESTVHSSPAASGQCCSPLGVLMDENAVASMSPAKEAHGKGRQIDHAAGLARQGGGSSINHAAGLARQTAAHRLQLVANCSTSDAVGDKSARNIMLAALQSLISDAEFVELSRGRPVVKRTISGMKCIHSCCTSYTRKIDQIL